MLVVAGVIVVTPVPMGEFSTEETDNRSAGGSKLTAEEVPPVAVNGVVVAAVPDGLNAGACRERLVATAADIAAPVVAVATATAVDCVLLLCCCCSNFSRRRIHIRL